MFDGAKDENIFAKKLKIIIPLCESKMWKDIQYHIGLQYLFDVQGGRDIVP